MSYYCMNCMANSPRLLGCWSNTESFGLQIHTQWAWVALHRGPGGMVGILDELTIHILSILSPYDTKL
jgi:hypothetical protein